MFCFISLICVFIFINFVCIKESKYPRIETKQMVCCKRNADQKSKNTNYYTYEFLQENKTFCIKNITQRAFC